MRLINTSSIQLEEKVESDLPLYAILSHRWGKKKFSLKTSSVLALSQGFNYAWMDTCCINKTNDVELSEAINSMYRWYQSASLCIAYLIDVGRSDEVPMEKSEWFERGWTLQELIAPKDVSFYNKQWMLLGTKQHLLTLLSERTKIPESVLSHEIRPQACSAAQRISWAADRKIERVEDRAYSLMGLFDVYLSKIYGERENAFYRLQEEIIKKSDDESIFAWTLDPAERDTCTGLLAPSPSSFLQCNDVTKVQGSSGFHMSNLGLSITLETFPYRMMTYLAILHCGNSESVSERYCILITSLPGSQNQYARVMNRKGEGRFLLAPKHYKRVARQIYIRQIPEESPYKIAYGFWFRTLEPPGFNETKKSILSRAESPLPDYVFLAEADRGTAGVASFERQDKPEMSWSRIRWVKVGFDEDFNPMCLVGNSFRSGVTPDPTAFEAAVRAEPGSATRDRVMNNAWITAEKTPPSRKQGWASGAYIKKISGNAGGETFVVEAVNLRVAICLCPYQNPASASDDAMGPGGGGGGGGGGRQKIWTVDITDTSGDSPEWDLRRHQCEIWTCCLTGTLTVFFGGSFCIKHAREMMEET